MCQCLIFLEEPLEVANILEKLSRGSSADAMMAYQVHLLSLESIWLTCSWLDCLRYVRVRYSTIPLKVKQGYIEFCQGPLLKSRVLSAIRKTAPGVEDETLKAGEEKMEDDSSEEKKAEVAPKKELTGEEAELQSKVRKPLSVGSKC